jgi:RimJ/RimL family protein N-acetyltransferase
VFTGQDDRHTATVGYWLGEKFWGGGIMTVVTAVTDFFRHFPFHESRRGVCEHPASARVLESWFHFEARLKNNVMKDGHFDSLLYARTK